MGEASRAMRLVLVALISARGEIAVKICERGGKGY